MVAIVELQKQIVDALEEGKDPAGLLEELAEVKASLLLDAEREALQAIANERKDLKNRALEIVARVKRQGEAIDDFLEFKAFVLDNLVPMLPKVLKLAKMANPSWAEEPGECCIFDSIASFQAQVKDIPHEILPEGFACPTLEMSNGQISSQGQAMMAYKHFQACVGILQGFQKGNMRVSSKPTDKGLMLDETKPEHSTPKPEEFIVKTCPVCDHEHADDINRALKDHRPLRDIEKQYGISKSSLSIHNRKCPVRMIDAV
jgi:hypothetical protein